MTLPEQSKLGALTGHENTAVFASPSLSVPPLSAKLKVPDAGFIRAQVNTLRLTKDEELSKACFPASASVSPLTSAMATGPVDA